MLDGVGLGLALVSEMTRTAKSIQERYEQYREGPLLFDKIDATLTRLSRFADNLDQILRGSPESMPQAVLADFVGTLTTVKDTLLSSDNAVAEYCSRAYVGKIHLDFESKDTEENSLRRKQILDLLC